MGDVRLETPKPGAGGLGRIDALRMVVVSRQPSCDDGVADG